MIKSYRNLATFLFPRDLLHPRGSELHNNPLLRLIDHA